jgi:hypothetical protein
LYREALDFLLLHKRRLFDAVRAAGFAEWREVPPVSSELGSETDRFRLFAGDQLLAEYWVIVDPGPPTRLMFRFDNVLIAVGDRWEAPHPDDWRRVPDDAPGGDGGVN